jgi:single-stranded DNA-binding protein
MTANRCARSTSWHQIVIWNEAVGEVAQRYAKKGSQLCVEDQSKPVRSTETARNDM